MPYVFTGNCPKCGAPILCDVTTDELNQFGQGQIVSYEIEYNCQCYKEERKKKEELTVSGTVGHAILPGHENYQIDVKKPKEKK